VPARHSSAGKRPRPAKLSDKQFKRLQQIEDEVGLALMAYQ